MNRLTTLRDAIVQRIQQERGANDWGSVAASEQELAHVSGQLSQAQADEARKAAELATKKRTADAAQAWADAQADADALRAEWAAWVNETTAIDARLDALAAERKRLDARAGELYRRGDALRGEPIAVALGLSGRLSEVQQYRIPTIRG